MNKLNSMSTLLRNLLVDMHDENQKIMAQSIIARENYDYEECFRLQREYIQKSRIEFDVYEKGLENLEKELHEQQFPKPEE